MQLMAHRFETLEELFVHQLEDIYDAETRLTKALPKMAQAAHSPQLKQAFEHHLRETEGHVDRLKQIFQTIGKEPKRETCPAMKGLIQEGEEMVNAKGNDAVRDAALIAAAQRVEHYEIAGYGTLKTFAEQLGRQDVADLLNQTLKEEGKADKKLTEIATSGLNQHAK